MIVEAQVAIRGSREAVWAVITDIGNASAVVGGIERIELLERPAHGLVGFKWRETRILFGDPASADKWITDAVENESYRTRAEGQGCAYLCTRRIVENGDGVTLVESHETKPLGLGARFMLVPMRLFFRGAIKKALLQDLEDIKAAVEQRASLPA
jgi:hypothetical protein